MGELPDQSTITADVVLPLGVTVADIIEQRDKFPGSLRRCGEVHPFSCRDVYSKVVVWST